MTDQAKDTQAFPIGAAPKAGEPDNRRLITMKAPTEGQLLVLTRIVDLAEEDGLEAVQLFGDAMEQMMVDPVDVKWLHRALLRNVVTPEDLATLAQESIAHFMGGDGNRAERRAASGRRRSRATAK